MLLFLRSLSRFPSPSTWIHTDTYLVRSLAGEGYHAEALRPQHPVHLAHHVAGVLEELHRVRDQDEIKGVALEGKLPLHRTTTTTRRRAEHQHQSSRQSVHRNRTQRVAHCMKRNAPQRRGERSGLYRFVRAWYPVQTQVPP